MGNMDGYIETSRSGFSSWGVIESFGTRVGGLKESFGLAIIFVYGILIEPLFIAHIANNIFTVKDMKRWNKKDQREPKEEGLVLPLSSDLQGG
jgi:hypothetical protein